MRGRGGVQGDPAERDVFVYLPPSYTVNRSQRFPVLYLLHGYGRVAETWVPFIGMPGSFNREEIEAGAKALLLELAAERPDDGQIQNQLGKACFELEEVDLAIQHFETSMRLNPRSQRGFHLAGIGLAHFVSHRFEDALAALRVSLEEVPAFVPAYRTLVACCAHMGRLDEARSILKRLVTLTPVVVPTASPFRRPEDGKLFLSGLRLAADEDA